MVLLKYLLMWGGIGMIAVAAGILAYDLYLEMKYRQALELAGARHPCNTARTLAGALPSRCWRGVNHSGAGYCVVPSGMGAGSSQPKQWNLPGTLSARTSASLAENIVLFDTRDQLLRLGQTGKGVQPNRSTSSQRGTHARIVHHRALTDPGIGLHPEQLATTGGTEIVPAVVASAWRELVPNYTVRIFAAKREEIRHASRHHAETDCRRNHRKVMLRDIQLPPQ
jgi:hypothetical protein